ncbi:aldehyde dehydrogenase [Edaphobacillus lindanitolerans]|uniref:Aldehyde dehydrogenase n=1 Tax=Edaphobacillus lindanitolerans TaxID=550447 RepID=A0A1U7PLY4_9BACI|nr:aldehyde dehydrogenase [Edaphobacillus lindanitolerans]SIT68530.1 aldehyde dehydrogenase (NAD+) [Edaphobacillus lindanitolerans]
MRFTEQTAGRIVAMQKDFYRTGSTKPARFRKERLKALYEAIRVRESDILEALRADLGKSAFEAYVTEVGFVLSSIRDTISKLDGWMEPEPRKTPVFLQPGKSFVVREPWGTTLIIGPFNYPFQLLVEPLAASIAAGNTAVLKPSETAPHTASVVRDLIRSVFEPGHVTVVEGGKEETSALLSAPFDFMFFTGSAAVGRIVMKAAAERLVPVVLELGGKSPAIVDQTADLRLAAERIAWGKFTNTGQTCVAPDYVLVHHSVKDRFMGELAGAIRRFYGKDPSQSPDYGRIVDERQFDRLRGMLDADRDRIVLGGRMNRDELFIEPTVLDRPAPGSPAMSEEIFGPILPVYGYGSLIAAVREIREKPKPLAAYLFSGNRQAIDYFLSELPFGGGCINDTMSHVGNIDLPFGGAGPSGIGSYHGRDGFNAFSHAKAVLKRGTFPAKLAFPPYGNRLGLVRRFMK